MCRAEANPAPKSELSVAPRLFMDIKRAKSVPSIPGGHRRPEMIRNGINLQEYKRHKQRLISRIKYLTKITFNGFAEIPQKTSVVFSRVKALYY